MTCSPFLPPLQTRVLALGVEIEDRVEAILTRYTIRYKLEVAPRA